MTYSSQHAFSVRNITDETEKQAASIAKEAISAIKEYPSYEWLITYWSDHADELDVEYDVDFYSGIDTKEKYQTLTEHAPGLRIEYADRSEIEALSEEDQKLFAEIAYSWTITKLNEIKRAHKMNFLFVVRTEAPYNGQFFVFSAADEGAERGTNYEQVYILGVTVDVTESQQEAMRSAIENSSHVADAGKYIDYYAYMDTIGKNEYLVGITYDQSEKLEEVNSMTLYEAAITIACLILLSVFCSIGILFFVLKPLKKVQSNIRLYKDTKQSGPVIENLNTVRMNNEIGELSSDIIHLTKELDNYLAQIKVIAAKEEKFQAELSLAMHIQASMLPHDFPPFPDRHEFNIYASMDPARAVGGDFYDFYLVDDDHLCLVIADVSGKGIPAALFMMIAKIIIKNCAMLGRPVSEVLETTNTALCEGNQAGMFVTVWMGILEISTGKLTAGNAGHEYPAIKPPNGNFEIYKDKHGIIIGSIPGVKFKEYELQLEPGSKIFLYTDGVPEATNAENQMFGIERTIRALNLAPESTPEKILENTRMCVDDFVKDAEQFDDLTMLCLEYKGPGFTDGPDLTDDPELTDDNA